MTDPTPSHQAAVHVLVRGRVQGVGFRYFALDTAQNLGLVGWVRNLPDGTVEAYAEGNKRTLESWIDHLHQGPSLSRVDSLDTHWQIPSETFTIFQIR